MIYLIMGRVPIILFAFIAFAPFMLSTQSNAAVNAVNADFEVLGVYLGNKWKVEFPELSKLSVTVTGQTLDGSKGPNTVFLNGVSPQRKDLPSIYTTVTSVRLEGDITAYVTRNVIFSKSQKGTARIEQNIQLTDGKAYAIPINIGAARGLLSIDATASTLQIKFQFTDAELSKICTEDYNEGDRKPGQEAERMAYIIH